MIFNKAPTIFEEPARNICRYLPTLSLIKSNDLTNDTFENAFGIELFTDSLEATQMLKQVSK